MSRADRIEAAARALLADLEDPRGSITVTCDYCGDLAMANGAVVELCDAHAAGHPGSLADRSYAPAVRALRAALAEVAP